VPPNNATILPYTASDNGIETCFEGGGKQIHNLSSLPQRIFVFSLIEKQHPFPASLGE
jgi:hypothetical protein